MYRCFLLENGDRGTPPPPPSVESTDLVSQGPEWTPDPTSRPSSGGFFRLFCKGSKAPGVVYTTFYFEIFLFVQNTQFLAHGMDFGSGCSSLICLIISQMLSDSLFALESHALAFQGMPFL